MKSKVHPDRAARERSRRWKRRGFTLLELLIATVVTLIMTALVAQMFQFVTEGIFNSRAMIEISDRLRNARHRLIQDLRGATAPTVPPLCMGANHGYFEYCEGPNVATSIGGDVGSLPNASFPVITSTATTTGILTNTGTLSAVYTFHGDLDDILMFTTYSLDDHFVGKAGGPTGTNAITDTRQNKAVKSRYAEVAWFARPVYPYTSGVSTLHRRSWLLNGYDTWGPDYNTSDQTMREDGGPHDNFAGPGVGNTTLTVVLNNLGDLTMRERRSVHQPYDFPYEMLYTFGGQRLPAPSNATVKSVITVTYTAGTSSTAATTTNSWPGGPFGLPTLMEQTAGSFPDPRNLSFTNRTIRSRAGITLAADAGSSRESDDVILNDVVSFDVKAWDPGAPVFRAALANAATITSNVTDTTMVGLIVPGDGGYGGDGLSHNGITFPRGALHRFINSPNTAANQPVSFGAFADLNYMWLSGVNGTGNVITTTSAMNKYLTALHTYEEAVLRKNDSPTIMVHLPRPAFGFASRGRILSGWPEQPPGMGLGDTGQNLPAVWDTWSRHYEFDGIDNDYDGFVDEGTDGIDNNNNGFVDEFPVPIDGDSNGDGVIDKPLDGYIDGNESYAAEQNAERDAPPPFDAPLRGIKVTIRIMEQDSRQVREVSTIHEFIPF